MDSPAHQLIWFQQALEVSTEGRGTTDVTQKVADIVIQGGVRLGLCHIFMQHTSASVILTENADRSVHDDLERFMQSTVPDSKHLYRHDSEGSDDMPSHIRSILTNVSLSIPVSKGQLALGIWQGIYLWEHRLRSHNRTLVITVHGIE
jgi:secondary thiamine-phosphate synthase enzyme